MITLLSIKCSFATVRVCILAIKLLTSLSAWSFLTWRSIICFHIYSISSSETYCFADSLWFKSSISFTCFHIWFSSSFIQDYVELNSFSHSLFSHSCYYYISSNAYCILVIAILDILRSSSFFDNHYSKLQTTSSYSFHFVSRSYIIIDLCLNWLI